MFISNYRYYTHNAQSKLLKQPHEASTFTDCNIYCWETNSITAFSHQRAPFSSAKFNLRNQTSDINNELLHLNTVRGSDSRRKSSAHGNLQVRACPRPRESSAATTRCLPYLQTNPQVAYEVCPCEDDVTFTFI